MDLSNTSYVSNDPYITNASFHFGRKGLSNQLFGVSLRVLRFNAEVVEV